MVKFLKPGKAVILLSGKYAGKKAVIVRQFDEGFENRHYGHCIVAGVARAPKKVTRGMGKRKIGRRNRVKPFVKVVNNTHIMPTRYSVDFELKTIGITPENLSNTAKRVVIKREVRKLFQKKHVAGKNRWFFTKLRF